MYARDWTPLPAAQAYRDLVYHQWWTEWSGRTDSTGKCTVRAFYGKHLLKAGDKEKLVELKSEQGHAGISF